MRRTGQNRSRFESSRQEKNSDNDKGKNIVEKESKERSGRVGRKYVGEQRDGRSPG